MNKKDLEQIRELIREELTSKSKCKPIEQVQPLKVEPKFEVGKWYKTNVETEKHLYCVTKIDGDYACGYGFGCSGSWYKDSGVHWTDNVREAAREEVEEALIKEAENRGFEKGKEQWIIGLNGKRMQTTSMQFSGLLDNNHMLKGNQVIFEDGKWATIINNKHLNGKDIHIGKDYIKIGCKTGTLQEFKDMVSSLEHWGVDTIHNSEIGDVKVKDLKDLL